MGGGLQRGSTQEFQCGGGDNGIFLYLDYQNSELSTKEEI